MWQWYDCNKLADLDNVHFAKYTRINYAFFKPDLQDNLYRMDKWANPQLLFGPCLQDATAHMDDNKRCSLDRPGVQNCNHHDLSRGLLHLAVIAAAARNCPGPSATQGWSRHHPPPPCPPPISGSSAGGVDCWWGWGLTLDARAAAYYDQRPWKWEVEGHGGGIYYGGEVRWGSKLGF